MSQAAPTEDPGLIRSLDRYWFGYGSPVTLGVFRMVMGTLIFINLGMIGCHWESWFSERGYVPAWLGQLWLYPKVWLWPDGPQVPRIDLINGITTPAITIPFYILVTLAALTTALGLWTRGSTIVLGIGLVSLHHRNAAILHGGDTVIRVMALYLMLAPCGRACSVDRLIGLWKGTVPVEPAPVSMWPQRLIAYNVALLYLTTTWLKYWGNLWREGTATYFPAQLNEFHRFYVPPFLNQAPMIQVTTYATLAVEFALGTLVFFRSCRKWVLLSGILLHLYIDYSMNIPLFSYIMIATYISFYDGEEVSGWAKRVGQKLARYRVQVAAPKGVELSSRRSAFFAALDPFGLVAYVTGDGSTWVSARSGAVRSLGAWSFAWIPGLWQKLLDQSLVARNVPEEAPEPAPKKPKRSKK